MILQRHRRTEHRHDPVASEFVDRAAVPLYNGGTAVSEVGHDFPQPLCAHRRRDVHRMNHIGEENCHLLVLCVGVTVADW